MNKVEKKEINVFWSLRFLAFMLIFIHHTRNFHNLWRVPSLAVSFFIIISGFLNGLIYINKYDRITVKEVFAFAKNKISKVYLVHLIMFFVTIPLSGVFYYKSLEELYFWLKRAFCNLLLMQSWVNNDAYYFGFNGVSWFLSVFLLLVIITIPFLVLLKKIKDRKNANIFLIIIALILFAVDLIFVHYVYINGLDTTFYLYVLPISRVPEYLIGMIFGVLVSSWKTNTKYNKGFWTVLELLACTVLTLFILFKPDKLGILKNYFIIKLNWWIIPIIIMLLIFRYERGLVSKILSNKLFINLGKKSMLLFLIHQPFINYVSKVAIDRNSMINKNFVLLYILILSLIVTIIMDKYLINRKNSQKLVCRKP